MSYPQRAAALRQEEQKTEGRRTNEAFAMKTRADLVGYMDATGKSQSDVARGTGLSTGTISQFIGDKYGATLINVAKKIAAWLSLEARRAAAPSDPLWIQTKNAREILMVLAQCHELRDLGMVYGAAGSGKTRTAQHYKGENPDTILITCTRAIRHPRAFLRHLAQLENVKASTAGSMDSLLDGVLARLRNSGRLLIVDEAQMLDYGAIELVRSLHDLAGVGVVLMGNEIIWQMLYEGRTRAQYEQLASRVGIKRYVQPGFPRADVEAVARQYINGAENECIAYLATKAEGVGGLRSVVKHCRLAFRMVAREERAVTVQDLERASALLG